METWSDSPIHANFKVKFFLDTNILAYLVDRSFTGLTGSFKFLIDCVFVELKSSRFVIFEFVKIRKREYFLRKILETNTNTRSGKVNLSSLLKYKEKFSHQGLDYFTESKSIKRKVLNEVQRITNEFKVDFENNELHSEIWKPTFDLCLASKLSGEDTLVTISCSFPLPLVKENHIHIVTNDNQFDDALTEEPFKRKIDSAYRMNNLTKPSIIHIEKISSNNVTVNLTKSSDDHRAKNVIFNKVKDAIFSKNVKYFIGKTISVPAGAPNNVICFTLPAKTTLNENLFLVFVGRNLDFIYTSRLAVVGYVDNMLPLLYPYVNRTQDKNLAFRLDTVDDAGIVVPISPNIMLRLREPGNSIFVHPDSF